MPVRPTLAILGRALDGGCGVAAVDIASDLAACLAR